MQKPSIFLLIALMWFGLAQTALAQACAHPGQPLTAIMETHKLPPYPQLSQMTGEQGTTSLKVTIGVDGSVSNAQIAKSSGSLRLDEAARDFVKSTYRWNPPLKDCKPIETSTYVSVVWDLRTAPPDPRLLMVAMDPRDYPAEALARHEQGVVAIVVYITPEGGLLNTVVLNSSGFPDLDAKALEVVKTRYRWTPAQLERKSIPTMVLLGMAWTLPDQPAPSR